LFGVKTKLKFGKLDVTSIFSQQRSQAKNITITNGAQQNINITAADYEAISTSFYHNISAITITGRWLISLSSAPISTSRKLRFGQPTVPTLQPTRAIYWHLLTLVKTGRSIHRYNRPGSGLPAGFRGPGFTQQSNNLLTVLPPTARNTNSNDVANLFSNRRYR
jgi:hypothetical protein